MQYKILLGTLLFSFTTLSSERVIYGDDNRLDYYQVKDPEFLNLADSTAVMVSKSKLKKRPDGTYQFKAKTMGEAYKSSGMNFCHDEPFLDQLSAGRCSGFLVGDDLMVTAGHCLSRQSECSNYVWVFNFKMESQNSLAVVSEDDVYQCQSIVESTYNNDDDYSLFRLRRKTDRRPLAVRRSGKVRKSEKLVVIGYPSGLPVKVAEDAYVRENAAKDYFVANLDTYGGNSGSAVFNCKTSEVEGILVRGETDFVYNQQKKCYESNRCSNTGCRGEDVVRITNIKSLAD